MSKKKTWLDRLYRRRGGFIEDKEIIIKPTRWDREVYEMFHRERQEEECKQTEKS